MTGTSHTTNQNWFHIRYDTSAPAGLPPVIQAERVIRYRDETGTWVIAVWDPTGAVGCVAACILRVPAEQVLSVTRHDDMGAAADQMSPAPTRLIADVPASQPLEIVAVATNAPAPGEPPTDAAVQHIAANPDS